MRDCNPEREALFLVTEALLSSRMTKMKLGTTVLVMQLIATFGDCDHSLVIVAISGDGLKTDVLTTVMDVRRVHGSALCFLMYPRADLAPKVYVPHTTGYVSLVPERERDHPHALYDNVKGSIWPHIDHQ